MEVTVDIKEDGKMETTSSVYGEEPEVDESEWKIENDKLLMTYSDQTVECEYADGKLTIDADGMTMIMSQEKEEYELLGEDHIIDLSPLLVAALSLELPHTPLCDDECKGLCAGCGANLNVEECTCEKTEEEEDEFHPNPFSVLRNIKFEE